MRNFALGLAILAATTIPVFGQDSIAPTTFSATIPVGTSTSVNKTVVVGKIVKPVDILFLLDTTGSMGPTLSSISSSFISSTVPAVSGFAANAQFGVGDYKDFFQCPPDGHAYQLDQNITSTNASVDSALAALSASGGCDDPESNLFGLQQAALTTTWRAGSERIIVWVGDNAGHDPAGTATEATAIAALKAQGVMVIAASASSGPGLDAVCDSAPCGTPNGNQAVRIVAAVGGSDIGTFDPTTINGAIQTAILNAIAKYSTVSLGVSPVPAGVSIGIVPGSITGSFTRATANTFNFAVNFTGTFPGVYPFSINALVDGATVATETDNITVTALPPSIIKSFSPTKIVPGGTSTLTLLISNLNAATVSGVGVVDTLPAGVLIASPNSLTNNCGGSVAGAAGANSVTLTGGAIAAGGSCTIILVVTSNEGIKVNTTDAVTSVFGTGNTGTATLSVATPPVLTKAFSEVSIGSANPVSLTLTLTNPNAAVTLTGLAFTDPLPSGLIVASPSVVTGACDGGTISAVALGNDISLTGATLAPGASCTFSVVVMSNGAALGYVTNTTSTVTSVQATPGSSASAVIFIGDPFQISYAANLAVGDSVVDITNAGTAGAALPSGTSASITGALCANVFAFTPDEQLVSCCSCPVTPNGLVSLSAKNDLASNTLTPATPTALVIKILATVPVSGSCRNSAGAVGTAALANGIKSFGTTIHATPVAGTYGVTEKSFSPAALSAGELGRLGNLCSFILANGSGFGVCRSCALGGQ